MIKERETDRLHYILHGKSDCLLPLSRLNGIPWAHNLERGGRRYIGKELEGILFGQQTRPR